MLTLSEAALKAGVEPGWLRKQATGGKIPVTRKSSGGRQGFTYLIDEQELGRLKLRYLRGKHRETDFDRGLVRDGIVYLHDGSIERV